MLSKIRFSLVKFEIAGPCFAWSAATWGDCSMQHLWNCLPSHWADFAYWSRSFAFLWRNEGVIAWLQMVAADHRPKLSYSPDASPFAMLTGLMTGSFTMDKHPLIDVHLRALIHFANCTCQSCSQSRGIAYSSWPTKTGSTNSKTSQTEVRNMKGNGAPLPPAKWVHRPRRVEQHTSCRSQWLWKHSLEARSAHIFLFDLWPINWQLCSDRPSYWCFFNDSDDVGIRFDGISRPYHHQRLHRQLLLRRRSDFRAFSFRRHLVCWLIAKRHRHGHISAVGTRPGKHVCVYGSLRIRFFLWWLWCYHHALVWSSGGLRNRYSRIQQRAGVLGAQ